MFEISQKIKLDYNLEEEKEIERLYKRYERQITFYLKRKGVVDKDISLFISEFFFKIFVSMKKYNPVFKKTTWMYSILKNMLVDYFRWKNSYKHNTLSFVVFSANDEDMLFEVVPVSLSNNPQEELEKQEYFQLINDILESIPEKYSNLIKMKYFENMSLVEIMKETGLSLSALKSKLFKGRNLIREKLEKVGIKDNSSCFF